MKAIITEIDGTQIEIDIADIKTITLSADTVTVEKVAEEEEFITSTPVEAPVDTSTPVETPVDIENIAPTVSEPPSDVTCETDDEVAEPIEEIVSENVADAEETIVADDPISEIVDMVSDTITRAEDAVEENNPVVETNEPAEEIEIPDAPVEEPETVTLSDTPAVEEKKEEPAVANTSFTEL